MKKMNIAKISFFLFLTAGLIGCKKDKDQDTDDDQPVPAVYQKIYGATSITSDGTYIYIKTNGTPDHKSVYYSTSSSLYENFSGTTFGGYTFSKNPNTISSKNYTFKIPQNPTVSASHSATPLGPIGVAINGVPFFNQYAGPNFYTPNTLYL
jgi:hypothetical protein